MEKRIPLYYADQTNWGPREFNALNSHLNRLFLHENQQDKADAISRMDLTCMSRETIAFIGAVLKQYDKISTILEKYPNLQTTLLEVPLSRPLYLSENPLNLFPADLKMNIRY